MKHKHSLEIHQGKQYCQSNTCNSADDCKPQSPEFLWKDAPRLVLSFFYHSRKHTGTVLAMALRCIFLPQKPHHNSCSIKQKVWSLLLQLIDALRDVTESTGIKYKFEMLCGDQLCSSAQASPPKHLSHLTEFHNGNENCIKQVFCRQQLHYHNKRKPNEKYLTLNFLGKRWFAPAEDFKTKLLWFWGCLRKRDSWN